MIYDLIVIGAGPGGYSAAIRAAQRGLKVLLIEKEQRLGGACLHRGCIPSKAFLAAAEMVEIARRASKVGIHFNPPKIDFERLVVSKDEKVLKLSQGLAALVKGNKIDLISGEGDASLEDPRHLKVGGKLYEARFLLLATGTEPVRPSSFPFDGVNILTTDELFQLRDLPKSLLIVGGGVSGCEMACAFNLLGVEVTLVELLPEILSNEEKTASKGLRTVFERRGIRVLTGISVQRMQKGAKVEVGLSNGAEQQVDKVLVAIGRKSGQDRLGLSKLGIAMERGYVKVDERMETSVEGVYAIGDLVGTTLLAHGAMAEGICAVENIAGSPDRMPIDYATVPRVTYTIPEIASIGVREEELKQRGIPYRAGRFSYLANGKALCHEEEEGFAQILAGIHGETRGKVLGATIFGAHAADLIQEVALVMRNRLPLKTLMQTIHAHPSLGEILHEAAEDTEGMAIHKIGRRV